MDQCYTITVCMHCNLFGTHAGNVSVLGRRAHTKDHQEEIQGQSAAPVAEPGPGCSRAAIITFQEGGRARGGRRKNRKVRGSRSNSHQIIYRAERNTFQVMNRPDGFLEACALPALATSAYCHCTLCTVCCQCNGHCDPSGQMCFTRTG